MKNDRYNVLLQYDPDNTEIRQRVIAYLTRLDPTAAQRLKKLIPTGRLIVKRNTNLDTAKRLKHLLKNTGAACRVKKLSPLPVQPAASMEKSPEQFPLSDHGEPPVFIKCPNCGFKQPPEAECRACGVIVSKAKGRSEPQSFAVKPAVKTSPETPGTFRTPMWIHCYIQPIVTLWKKIEHPLNSEKLSGWYQRVTDKMIRCGIVFIIALILEVGLLYLGKMMWYLYTETAVGQYYIKNMPEEAEPIQRTLAADPLNLGWDITIVVMLTGLLLGCAAQFFQLIRYLYSSQGILGKLIIWFIPTAGFTAWMISQQHPYPNYPLAGLLVALPTLCILSSCLLLAQTALPEIGDFRKIFRIIAQNREKTWGYILKRIRIWLDASGQVD